MQFKHPELLYALFLLLIPILVHLFQLRRFKKEAFTNVAFLKKLNIQTRKSSTIKKWILLLTRLAVIACIVLAFAQPFFTQSENATKEKETVIYLDNSFSMQAKGPSGQLLKTAAQDLITNVPEDQNITLLTNTETYRNTSVKDIRNTLLQLKYTPVQLSENAVSLKAQKEFTNNTNTEKRLVLISDFQDKGTPDIKIPKEITTSYIQLSPVIENNVSIDSLYISAKKPRSYELTVQLSTQQNREVNTPVSLYNGQTLVAKGTAAFDNELTTTVTFDIDNNNVIAGRIVIEDPFLVFDNTMYFSINKSRAIKVLAINGTNSSYLKRIFTAPDFNYTEVDVQNIDYSTIQDYNYIVVNEVEEIPTALVVALDAFAKAGNVATVVLNPSTSIASHNKALQGLGNFNATKNNTNKQLITTINYDHPIYSGVFDTRIKNFQYPSVSSSIIVQGGDPVLKYEDGSVFLTTSNGIYIITGGIDTANSNFKNSPLIVPTFYNMSRQSLSLPPLYFYASKDTSFDIPTQVAEDQVLSLKDIVDDQNRIIPLQQSQGSKVTITTSRELERAGIYDVLKEQNTLQQVSYNYTRDESVLRYKILEKTGDNKYASSVSDLFDAFKTENNIQSLWKWFVIFALFFLLLEILILKFYK